MDCEDIIPYTCVVLDACWKDFLRAAMLCAPPNEKREQLIEDLQKLWRTAHNPNPPLPCLSVRTGFDLYLQVMQFPVGSEIIMSAINIPDMVYIVHHHGLKVVPIDVNLETLAPKVELLDSLVTPRTVAILLAHVFGKWFDVAPFITASQRHNLYVIEDCAEVFCGFEKQGHPETDISLFSFGVIKHCTSFGGAIAKVKDLNIYNKMSQLQETYPLQGRLTYLSKVIKYSFVYLFLNCPRIIRPTVYLAKTLNIDHKKHVVNMLRGFPNQLIKKLRHRPSVPLLSMMLSRLSQFDTSEINMANFKGEYVSERLPDKVTQVGTCAQVKNYWLFPIVVENPDEVVKALVALGVDAYRGATQLNLVEPDNGNNHLKHIHSFATRYPHEAKFLIDHVVYLPVNKFVPFYELDKVCRAVDIAIKACNGSSLVSLNRGIKLPSKL